MPGAAHEQRPVAASSERRVSDRRRTYNRRRDDGDISPPYFEVFERIAVALENINATLSRTPLTLPDTEARTPADSR